MTHFREQMESLRQSHHEERYPGDLALDALIPPRRIAWLPLALAAAACVLVGLLLVNLLRPAPPRGQTLAVAPDYPIHRLPAMPPVPHVSLSLPSMPPFPSLDDVQLAYEDDDSVELNEVEDPL
jgi:hypothetical protein